MSVASQISLGSLLLVNRIGFFFSQNVRTFTKINNKKYVNLFNFLQVKTIVTENKIVYKYIPTKIMSKVQII
jgi:hypothetical protein